MMLKNRLLLLIFLCSFLLINAQNIEYSGERIAISFDGNSAPDNEYKWPIGDPDDWGASAASLAIIAKLKLQNKLVHCSYNNFIDAPPGPDNENQVKISLDGAAERWKFKKDIFFDITTHKEAAIKNLVHEISISTADNPLYFLHAGLSEFVYQALAQLVATKNTECLKYLHFISHSGFNENEKRRAYHRDFNDIRDLCNNSFGYTKIQDQNDKNNPHNLWNSGKDFSVWYWMRDHKDENIRWMYTRVQSHNKNVADISDCGMLFYLLVGDENGNPEKFRAFIGEGI